MGSFQSCWIRRLVTLKNPNAFHLAASLNMLAISLLTVASRWLWFQESHAYMVTSVKKRSFSSHTFVFMREENLYQKHSPQPPRSLPLRSYWPKLITERGTTVICLSQSRSPIYGWSQKQLPWAYENVDHCSKKEWGMTAGWTTHGIFYLCTLQGSPQVHLPLEPHPRKPPSSFEPRGLIA